MPWAESTGVWGMAVGVRLVDDRAITSRRSPPSRFRPEDRQRHRSKEDVFPVVKFLATPLDSRVPATPLPIRFEKIVTGSQGARRPS